jgi:cbb3-type cytochrome c oxidase subunit III
MIRVAPDPEREALEASTRRWMLVGLILMALFVLAFPLFRLYEPARRSGARAQQEQFLADQGAGTFATSCESCHGVRGTGGLAPAVGARDFLETADDVQIAALVTHGVPGTEMVAYGIDFGGPLTSTQIRAITSYLRSLEEDAATNPLWRTPLADSNLSGRDLFSMACSRCHGTDLSGKDDVAPSLGPGSDSTEESDARLAKQIDDGGDEMPAFGGVLTPGQIEMLVAYLREVQSGG